MSSNNASNNGGIGISLFFSSNNNTLSGNNASNNYWGIILFFSSNNTLINNTMTGNSYNFGLFGWSDSDFNNQIDNSNTVDGKPIYYVKNAKNTVYDSSTNAGTFYCISCVNVTINDLNLNKNGYGISFWNTTISKIQNVNASNNGYGIGMYYSSNNNLINNIASNNTFWAFNSEGNSINNTVTNLTMNPTVSFTGKDIAIKVATAPAPDPNGYRNIGIFIEATNNSADSWLFLNVSYSNFEIAGMNGSTLRMWQHDDSWLQVPGINGVNTAQNYVYVNITSFSIFAPMGASGGVPVPATSIAGMFALIGMLVVAAVLALRKTRGS